MTQNEKSNADAARAQEEDRDGVVAPSPEPPGAELRLAVEQQVEDGAPIADPHRRLQGGAWTGSGSVG
ncbi:MAG: hypothetical protein QOI54_3678 [Actinomycetota bacterium]|jgi:hypothetical protein|nr:hypothetical protein [Actinomycetota bacterium]